MTIDTTPTPRGFSMLDREAYAAKRLAWSKYTLRQAFPDAAHMRDTIAQANLRCPHREEPATIARTRYLLRRAGVDGNQVANAMGTSLAAYLVLNPLLPLWAALAFVLEAVKDASPVVTRP